MAIKDHYIFFYSIIEDDNNKLVVLQHLIKVMKINESRYSEILEQCNLTMKRNVHVESW